MKYPFRPQTQNGRRAVSLFAAFIILAAVSSLISNLTQNNIEYPNPITSPLLGTSLYLTFTAAVLASLMGLFAVVRNKEHAVSVLIAIPLGIVFFILIIVFALANIIGPPG